MAAETLLQVNNLTTQILTDEGTLRAVDRVSLEIGRGESVGLVGESGCGKSMTALSIMGLQPPAAKIVNGRVLFGDKDLANASEEEMQLIRGKEIGMVFQDPMSYLNPVLRAGEQVAEVLFRHSAITKSDAEKTVTALFADAGIPSPERVVRAFPHQLSGGMRQRVMIAMAIACKPALLIADEPTTALDVTIQAQVLEVIKKLIKERGMSLLLITHDLGIVADVCDKVYVMYAGRIAEEGQIFELYADPKHPYTQGLLQSILTIAEKKKKLKTIEGAVPNLVNPPNGCRFNPRCPYVMPICREQEPPLVEIAEKRNVACLLYK